jgi:hypothetical protein
MHQRSSSAAKCHRASTHALWPLIVGALLAGACGRPAVEDPSGQEDIHLYAEVDRSEIGPGEVATVTFRLESVAVMPVRLDFASGCQIMPYVAEADTGVVVHPEGGTWACTMALTSLDLPPGGRETRTLRIRPEGTEAEADVALPPGEYLVHARLEDRIYQLVSTSLTVTIR